MTISRNVMNIINSMVSMLFIFMFYKIAGFAGVGLFVSSLLIFYILFTIMMGSIKTTTARMVAARRHRGFNDNAKKIYKKVLIYTVIVSAIMFLVFRVMAFFLSRLFLGDKIAGDILLYCGFFFALHAFCQCMIGNFLGNENIRIIALSEIISSVVMLIACPLLATKLSNYGTKVALLMKNDIMVELYCCEGAIIALCISSFIMLIILILGSKNTFKVEDYLYNELRGKDSVRSFLKTFLPIAFNIFKENIFPIATVFIAIVVYSNNYLKHGNTIRDNFTNLGILYMLSFIIISFCLLFYKDYIYKQKKHLHQDFKKDEQKSLVFRYNTLITNVLVILLPMMITVIIFSNDIVECLYKDCDIEYSSLLKYAGVLILFIGIDYFFKVMLESMNGSKMVLLGDLSGFAATMFYLIAIGRSELSINKILISLVLNYCITCLIHGFFSMRYIEIRLNDIIAKMIKVSISIIILIVVELIFSKLFSMNILILVLGIFVSYLVYYSSLIALKTYSNKDLVILEGSINYYPLHFGNKLFVGK